MPLKFVFLCIALFFYKAVIACEYCNCLSCLGEPSKAQCHGNQENTVPLRGLSASSAAKKIKRKIIYPIGADGKGYSENVQYPEPAGTIPEKVQTSFVVKGYLKKPKEFKQRVDSLYRNRESFDHVLSLKGDKLKGVLRYLSMKCNESGLPVLQKSFLDLANSAHRSPELMGESIYVRYDSQALAGGMALILSFVDGIIESMSSGLFDTVFIEENKFDICDGRYIFTHLRHGEFARHLGPVQNHLLWRTALISGGVSALITVVIPKIRDRLISHVLRLYALWCKKKQLLHSWA